MPPPVIRACFAAWADRVSMINPRSPSSRTVPSSISSSRQRFRLGPVSGWLLRSITCGVRDGGQREPGGGAPGEPHRMGGALSHLRSRAGSGGRGDEGQDGEMDSQCHSWSGNS